MIKRKHLHKTCSLTNDLRLFLKVQNGSISETYWIKKNQDFQLFILNLFVLVNILSLFELSQIK